MIWPLEAAGKCLNCEVKPEKHPSGAKALVYFLPLAARRPRGYPGRALSKQCLDKSSSAACEARVHFAAFAARLKSWPFKTVLNQRFPKVHINRPCLRAIPGDRPPAASVLPLENYRICGKGGCGDGSCRASNWSHPLMLFCRVSTSMPA